MTTRRKAVLLVLALAPWVGLNAQLAEVGTTFRVSARVNGVCAVTATNLDFGLYNSQSGSPLQGTTLLRATCTPSASYQVGLDAGTSPGATVNQRSMVSGSSKLNYQLYSDAARAVPWGNTPGTDTVTGVGTGLAQDLAVYGTIPSGQNVPSAEYSDTITVRVFY